CSPCALVIATPVAYLSAIAAAAKRGVLIKGGVYLETLARAKAIVFDKTGTLTTGRVKLKQVITHDSVAEDEALRLAGGLESSSSHPLAAAVMAELAEQRLEPYPVQGVTDVAGRGLSATSNGRRVWIGSPRFAAQYVDAAHRDLFETSLRSVYSTGSAASALVIDGVPNILVFEDTVRPNAAHTLARLRAGGVERIHMLTGDHELVAAAIAKELKVDDFRADLLPEDKLDAARELRRRHGPNVMVGDGVNDAPALAGADVGIAIGSIGADVALEAADIVLMNDSLEGVAWVHAHAKRTAQIVRQNLFLAIGVIVVLAGFALTGHIPLPLAVMGHEGSTLCVALNALRLLGGSKSRATVD
ncbi:MAG: heavy metal translocating P-type ATPase, partial [Phycisphaerae bacterium]